MGRRICQQGVLRVAHSKFPNWNSAVQMWATSGKFCTMKVFLSVKKKKKSLTKKGRRLEIIGDNAGNKSESCLINRERSIQALKPKMYSHPIIL